jgi:tricorn protease
LSSLLITALAATAVGQSAGQEMRLMRFPDIHGDAIVFTYAGDLWTSELDGGLARRLTSHAGQEIRAKFSPDGKWIAFTAEYDGNPDVYVVSADGGEPKRLTYEPSPDLVVDWTPDGKIAYKSPYGHPFTARLWMIDPKGGMPIRTKIEEFGDGTLSPDGKRVAYNRSTAHQFNWRRYRGGTQGKISFFNLDTSAYEEIASRRENSWFPMWVNANTVYFISDRNQGTVNLFRYNVSNKDLKQVTTFGDADIKWPATDGKKIVYERDGYLYTFDLATEKIDRLNPRVLSDNTFARPRMRNVSNDISSLALSPSGVRVAAEARGDIFSLPARSGETRNMTNSPGSRERFPAWSPDGKQIAYWSDAGGEQAIYVQPQMGGEPVKLTNEKGLAPQNLAWSPDGKYLSFSTRSYSLYILDVATKTLTNFRTPKYSGNTSFDWSPDSRWIAFIDGMPNFQDAVFLYNVAEGKRYPVTDGFYSDSTVAFDTTGKYLFFTSARTFNPGFGIFEASLKIEDATRIYAIPLQAEQNNPFILPPDEEPAGNQSQQGPGQGQSGPPGPPPMRIDMEGLAARAIPLPMPASNYGLFAGTANGVLFGGPGGLQQFTMGQEQPVTIFGGPLVGAWTLNQARNKIAYFSQGTLGIANLAPGLQVGAGRVPTNGMMVNWSPRQEWEQMFWEAWRYQRENFYDKNMLGLDWNAIGQRYAKYLPYVSHRGDLNYVMGMMIGELGTGHAYVQGGETGAPPGVPVGQLGVDFEPAGRFVRMAKIYRGRNYEEQSRAPLNEPGLNVKDGDYLLAIDGQEVNSDMNPNMLLVGKLGRTVALTINSTPSMTGSRVIRVRPIANEGNLRYVDWVEENRRKVAAMSNGRIGYMHIPNTATEGMIELIRGFYSQVDKEAILVDERFNGGGYIQPWFVQTLTRRVEAWITQRHFDESPDQAAMEGPMALLINGYAGSGGDFFPWMFKRNQRGPLIGMRTWGGLVGIAGYNIFQDGGQMSSPEFGFYDHRTGKWIAENTGVDPDIEVDARPDLLAKGQDPQLEAGVNHLLNELRKPASQRKRPSGFPVPTPPNRP